MRHTLQSALILLVLCTANVRAGEEGPLREAPTIDGLWFYGIDANPEFIVRVAQDGGEVRATWAIRDPASGAELAFAEARGRFYRFHEIVLHGKYLRWFQGTPPGEKFVAHWILYGNNSRIQEISLSGDNRITSYLVHATRTP